jgi:hypothetical protein
MTSTCMSRILSALQRHAIGTVQLLALEARFKRRPMCGVRVHAVGPRQAATVGMRLNFRRAQSAIKASRNTTRCVSCMRYPPMVCALGLDSHGTDGVWRFDSVT